MSDTFEFMGVHPVRPHLRPEPRHPAPKPGFALLFEPTENGWEIESAYELDPAADWPVEGEA
jgi:hypothetical protein